MKVLFKKLIPGAVIPRKATQGSAAYDLYVPEDFVVKKGRQIIPLGFAMEMPYGIEALIDARSGFSSKGMEGYRVEYIMSNHGFDLEKTPKIAEFPSRFDCDVIQGKIDCDYRDGVGVIINNRSPYDFVVKAGTRIAQMTFHKVETVEWEETDTLSETDRDGGFGSTGTK
jgi:dUTP pyrophosphatase